MSHSGVQPTDRVLREQSVKISTCNSRLARRRRDVAAGFPEKSEDGLALELPDQALLAGEQPVFDREVELARLLEMQGQMSGLDRPVGGEHHGPLDDVLELAKVAGPAVSVEQVEGVGADPFDLLVHLGG